MLDDELKKLWKDASQEEMIRYNKKKLLADLDTELKRIDKSIRNRDIREIVAGIAVVPVFALIAYLEDSVYTTVSVILLAVACGIITFMLLNTQKSRKQNLSLSLREFLLEQQTYISRQAKLLRNVFYWYILPLAISMAFFLVGTSDSTVGLVISFIVMILIGYGIYRLNQEAVQKDFNPLLEKLNEAIAELEEE